MMMHEQTSLSLPDYRVCGIKMVIFGLLVLSCLLTPCRTQQSEDLTDIRLVDGPINAPNSGRVEVLHTSGIWLNVCDYDYWGDNDGQVACLQLGFPGYSRVRRTSYFGEGTNNGSVGMIGCNGNEERLGQCMHEPVRLSTKCEGRVAGLICTVPGYLGCYVDDRNNRVFTNPKLTSNNMTIGLCLDHCRGLGMRYAGLENKKDCYCGDGQTAIDKYGRERDRNCRSSCLGNADEVCGGRLFLSIYDLTLGHCADPGTPANGGRVSLRYDIFPYASNITFYCNDGFQLVGSSIARCVLGDSPQEVTWDQPLPLCQYESTTPDSTQTPDNGGLGPVNGSGKIVGIVVACTILLIVMIVLVVLIVRKRRRRINKNNNGNGGQLSMHVYAEPGDPTRYQTTPTPQLANTEYQDLTQPSKDIDRPYTSLKKDVPKQDSQEIPEYLELDVDDPDYAPLGVKGQSNHVTGTDANGAKAARRPAGAGGSVAPNKGHRLPSPEINSNEYSYVDPTQIHKDSSTAGQSLDGAPNQDEYAEVGPTYYSIPPDTH